MRPCPTFRQLAICFGLLCSIGFGVSNAAPICSQVLTDYGISEDVKFALLDDLAQMKLAIDQARAGGTVTMTQKSMETAFQIRFGEAFNLYKDKLTIDQFKELIRVRIAEKQNTEVRIERIKDNQKQVLNDRIRIDQFTVERRELDVRPSELTYVPTIDALVIKNHTGMYKYDLQTRKVDLILEGIPQKYEMNGTKLIYVNEKGKYASRDLVTGAEEVYFENVFKKHYSSTDKALSKKGTWLAFSSHDGTSLDLFNANTKKQTKVKLFKGPSFFEAINNLSYENIFRHYFISTNEVLVYSSLGNVFVVNLVTGDRVNVDFPKVFSHDFKMTVTDDGYLIFTRYGHMGLIKIAGLYDVKRYMKIQEYEGLVSDVVKINSGTLVTQMFQGNGHSFRSVGTDKMDMSDYPVAEYREKNSFSGGVAVDLKGRRIFMGGWHLEGLPEGDQRQLPMIDILTPKKLLN
jgi:hypothetical protein